MVIFLLFVAVGLIELVFAPALLFPIWLYKELKDFWYGDERFNAKPLFSQPPREMTIEIIFDKIVKSFDTQKEISPGKRHYWCDLGQCGILFKNEKQSALSSTGHALVDKLRARGFGVHLDLVSLLRDGYDQSPRIRLS